MNPIELGFELFNEIEAVRKGTNANSWRWDRTIKCDDPKDVMTICSIAGCWCDVPSGYVRFYSNQNHPAHEGNFQM